MRKPSTYGYLFLGWDMLNLQVLIASVKIKSFKNMDI